MRTKTRPAIGWYNLYVKQKHLGTSIESRKVIIYVLYGKKWSHYDLYIWFRHWLHNRLFAFIAAGGGPGGKRFFVRPPEHAVVTSDGDMLWSQSHGLRSLPSLLLLSLLLCVVDSLCCSSYQFLSLNRSEYAVSMMDSERIKCVSCTVDLMIIYDVDLLQLQIILLLRWCLRFDLFGYNLIEKWLEKFGKVKVRNKGIERKVFNGHPDIGMDRTSCELEWHYQIGFRYLWSICVCECLWYQESVHLLDDPVYVMLSLSYWLSA